MNPEEVDHLRQLELAYRKEQADKINLQSAQASSILQASNDTNLIEWQLELDNIVESIGHMLRGHTLEFDVKGNMVYKESKDKEAQIFNDYGAQEILRVLTIYLNRNTILSNYDEQTINNKVYDLGIEIADLIYLKYEQMGMDTPEKRKLYMLIVREIIDTVHSTYLRALNGGERESLRTARTVHQTDPIGRMNQYPNAMPSRGGSKWYNPLSWGRD